MKTFIMFGNRAHSHVTLNPEATIEENLNQLVKTNHTIYGPSCQGVYEVPGKDGVIFLAANREALLAHVRRYAKRNQEAKISPELLPLMGRLTEPEKQVVVTIYSIIMVGSAVIIYTHWS